MRLLLTTDWHIDAVTAGRARLPELPAYIEELKKAGPYDHVFFLGDAFDPGSRLGPRYAYELLRAARTLHDSASVSSVWIAGNHDVIETEDGFTSLSVLRELEEITASPTMHKCFFLAEAPRFIEIPASEGSECIGVLCLPYVARAVERSDVYHEALGTAFGAAQEYRDAGLGPIISIGHLSVPGAKLGSESKEMARGRDVTFPAFDVARLRPALVAAGHYHHAQVVHLHGIDIVIPGSPHRFTFGERDDCQKGFTIVELQ